MSRITKRFEKLKAHLATSGPTTLKVEKAAPAMAQGRTGPPGGR